MAFPIGVPCIFGRCLIFLIPTLTAANSALGLWSASYFRLYFLGLTSGSPYVGYVVLPSELCSLDIKDLSQQKIMLTHVDRRVRFSKIIHDFSLSRIEQFLLIEALCLRSRWVWLRGSSHVFFLVFLKLKSFSRSSSFFWISCKRFNISSCSIDIFFNS